VILDRSSPRGITSQFVAAGDRLGVATLVFDHSHKQAPQIVNLQQQPRRTLTHRRLGECAELGTAFIHFGMGAAARGAQPRSREAPARGSGHSLTPQVVYPHASRR